jgi:hypothetical protein
MIANSVPDLRSASASSTAKIGGLSGKTPCSGCIFESLVVLRLVIFLGLDFATFLVIFFLVAFTDFFIGVFLPLFAFAFRRAIASPQIV